MNNKIEQLRNKLNNMDKSEFNNLLDSSFEISDAELNKKHVNWVKTDYLFFKPEKVKELAKSFTNAQAMINYKGNNKKLINAAGRLIQYKGFERPEWFEDIIKGNAESLVECLKIAHQYTNYSNFYKKEKRVYDRILLFISYDEMKNIFNEWMKGVPFEYTDKYICSILKKYKKAIDLKGTKDSHIRTKLQVDKGQKFPKSYALYRKMLSSQGNKKGNTRGNYQQRTPAIEQYDLNNKYIKTFNTWDDVIKSNFNRNSVTNAIKGADGHHRHKGFIWKYAQKNP